MADNQSSHEPKLDSSTQEDGPAALSKSKKKRLKKKRKIEAEAADKGKQEVESVEALEIRCDTITTKSHTQSDRKSNKPISGLGKGHQAVDAVSSSAKPNSSINSIKSPSAPHKCNNKPKEDRVQRNSEIINQSAVESGAAVERGLTVAGFKVESGGHSEAGVQHAKMDSKPSKDDVIAQREAKKLAKLAKKNKSGGDSLTSSGNEPTKENISNKLNVNTPKTLSTASAPVRSPVAAKTANDPHGGLQAASGTQVCDRPVEVGKTSQPSTEPGKTAKTREEIAAERETKKQAKLAAKNKKKDPGQPGDSAKVAPLPKDDSVKTEMPGGAEEASRISASDKPDVTSKEPIDSGASGEKSNAQLRAERRAKQEAQRAAKEAMKKETGKTKPLPGTTPSTKPETVKGKTSPSSKAASKPTLQSAKPAKAVIYQPKLLSHLQMDNRPLPSHIYQNVHPAIVELGAKYAARVVSGSNARCIALLQALKKVIADFVTPREKEFSRAMESRLNDSMVYLNASRQSSVSMSNALKHVKSHLTQLTTEKTTTDDEARRKLFEAIDTFIKEQIDVAGEAICNSIAKKISNGDTIAIYGCSSLLLRILVESRSEGKDFEVVVVDGGPLYEGREMCRRLVAENIRCTYVLLPAFSYIVGQTTKVLLGAHALLANGCVMSRSGTALVAMLAKAHNVPVIVCCETYKFCERVQADAFVHNELGPQHGSGSPPLISLMYDMTPPTLVDAVATELAILPCTSVPVILRVKPSDVSSYYY